MSLWTEWREQRKRSRRASTYLGRVLRAPDADTVHWLASIGVPVPLAVQEITFAVRAIGVIVAERDALDDRTASDVVQQLALVIRREPSGDEDRRHLWAERWRAYSASLAVRGSEESPTTRVARVFLAAAGVVAPSGEQLLRATHFIAHTRSAANDALRDVFGAAALPDHVRPSAVQR